MNSSSHWLISVPDWHLSGANTFMLRLLREARSHDVPGSVVVTTPVDYNKELLAPRPDDLKFIEFPPTEWKAIRQRQKLLYDTLCSSRPCVFFPQYDFDLAGISHCLPEDIPIVGILHSDEELYYDALCKYGQYWNLIIAVSSLIEKKARQRAPHLADRIKLIPYGVNVPPPTPKSYIGRLQVVYCGRIATQQKRILDLARLIELTEAQQLPIDFTVIGNGPDAVSFKNALPSSGEFTNIFLYDTLSLEETQQKLRQAHVMVMTSEYEGLPLVLLESMALGVIPLLTKFASGLDELIKDGSNGLLSPVGNPEAMLQNLTRLSESIPLREKVGRSAQGTLKQGPYNIEHCFSQYLEAIHQAPKIKRNKGFTPLPPKHYSLLFRLMQRLKKAPPKAVNPS